MPNDTRPDDHHKREWLVPYRVTYHGVTCVEADSAEDAQALIAVGDFHDGACAERMDWESTGPAREQDL